MIHKTTQDNSNKELLVYAGLFFFLIVAFLTVM